MTSGEEPAMEEFAGKSVAVTEGSLGMGRTCVERFALGWA